MDEADKKDSFRMITDGGTAEIVEKKSRFIATFKPVTTEEEAVVFIESVKKQYWDARHNCSAFVIGSKGELTRCSDDGEPSGTAGRPMLEILLGEGIRNIAVVVTRYFGGIKLGAGGLTRAYTNSVADALKEAEIVDKELVKLYRISVDYHFSRKVSYLIQSKNLLLMNTEYDEEVHYDVYLRDTSFLDELNELTASNMHYEVVKEDYIPVEV